MYRVITSAQASYCGSSRKLAEDVYSAAVRRGMCALMREKTESGWVDLKEHIS